MKRKKSKIPNWALTGHKKPVTRREFLAHGIIPFAGAMAAPQLLNLLFSNSSFAAQNSNPGCSAPDSGLIPFITLNLAGGAAMASNFVPMNAAGDPIRSYSKMGLGNNQLPLYKFGGGNFAGQENGVYLSKMLQGILDNTSEETRENTKFIGLCVRSRDDFAENLFGATGLVTALGLKGSYLPNMGKNPNSNEGVRQRSAILAPPQPLIVTQFSDVQSAIGYAAQLGKDLNQEQKKSLAKLINKLNTSQTRKLASINKGDQIKKLIDCAGIKNIDITSSLSDGGGQFNPSSNNGLRSIWGISPTSDTKAQDFVFASIVYNSLMGFAGAGSLEIGGYDYHNRTRTRGDQKDLEAGQNIGKILESAKVLEKPVFLYVTSDGSVVSTDSNSRNSVWRSDRGAAGASYIFMYDPTGKLNVTDNQIGYFTDEQVVDESFVIGGSPERSTAAVFANYLKWNGQLEKFSTIAGSSVLPPGELNKLVKVA